MLTRDGETVWQENPGMEWEDLMTAADAEEMAAAEPDHDWRIVLFAPLSGITFQRHGEKRWMPIENNQGFA